jgi:hypothetical protein
MDNYGYILAREQNAKFFLPSFLPAKEKVNERSDVRMSKLPK